MPTVSVIIPTYNRAKYICEAIDSVLEQTYEDYEIIVVDDGSTDDTRKVLSKYDNNIRYYYQNNRGVSSARNRGIMESIGEYIAFIDSDDIWLSDKLISQYEIMVSNQDIALITTDGQMLTKDRIVRDSMARSREPLQGDGIRANILKMKINDGSYLKGMFYKDVLERNFVLTSSVMVRKNILNEIGCFDENLLISEDYDLWLRICEKYPILYLNRITTHYSQLELGLSGKEGVREWRYRKWDGIMLEGHLVNCAQNMRELVLKRICESYSKAVWGYFHNSDFMEARTLSRRLLAFHKYNIKAYIYFLLTLLPCDIIRLIKNKVHLCQK